MRRGARVRRPPQEVYHPRASFASAAELSAGIAAGAGAGAGAGANAVTKKGQGRRRDALAAARKRAEEASSDPESDAAPSDPSDSDSDASDGSDVDFTDSPAKRGKSRGRKSTASARSRAKSPAASRAKTPASSRSKARGKRKRSPSPSGAPGDNARGGDDEADGGLWAAVSRKSVAIQSLVSDFVQHMEEDYPAATTELLNFLSKCCGSALVLNVEDVADADYDAGTEELEGQISLEAEELVTNMTEHISDDLKGFPLVGGKKLTVAVRRARKNVAEFWRRLYTHAQHNMLFAYEWPVFVSDVVVALCGSGNFGLRYSAAMIGLEVGTALVGVATSKQEELAVCTRQLKAAQASKKRNVAKERRLMKQREELGRKAETLEQRMLELFNSIIVNRYKDCHAELRADTIAGLGKWVRGFPALFMKEKYIKYIGWMLCDESELVRRASIEALIPLYKTPSFIPSLEKFTIRFKSRMVDMVFDSDEQVAVKATELIGLCNVANLVDEEDVQNMQEVFFEESLSRRQALARFMMDYLECFDEEAETEGTHDKRAQMQLRALVEVAHIAFQRSFGTTHFVDDLVSAFWNDAAVLRNWEAFTTLLMLDAEEEQPLDPERQQLLISMLMCACQTVQVQLRATGKAKLKTTARAAMEESANSLTQHFIAALPRLFTKFQADEGNLENLAAILRCMRLSNVAKARQAGAVMGLMSSVTKLYKQATSEGVCFALATGLRLFVQSDHAAHVKADQALRQLVGDLVSSAKAAVAQAESAEQANEDDTNREFSAAVALMRVSVLMECVPGTVTVHEQLNVDGLLCTLVLDLLAARCDVATYMPHFDAEVVKHASRLSLARLHWAVADLLTTAEGWAGLDAEAKSEFRAGVSAAAQFRDKIAAALESMLAGPAAERERVVEGDNGDAALAYLTTCQSYMHRAACDLMRLCPSTKFSNTIFHKLAWQVPAAVASSMVDLARQATDKEGALQLDAGFVEELHSSDYAKAELEAAGESLVSEEVQRFEENGGVSLAQAQAFVFPLSDAAFSAPASLIGSVLTHITHRGRVEEHIKKMYKLVRASRGTDFMFASVLEALKQVCESYLHRCAEADAAAAAGLEGSAEEATQEADQLLEDLLTLAKRLSNLFGVGKLKDADAVKYLQFLQRGLHYAFQDAPTKLVFATALSPFTRRLRPNHKRAIARVVARLIDNLGDAAAEHFHGWEQRADLPDEEKDVDQLDADLGWYALQNFRDDIQDASRTTGKPTTTRRRTPLKSRSPLKGRRSSAGTVPTPRRQLDMNLSDEAPATQASAKRKRQSQLSQRAADLSDDDGAEAVPGPSPAKKARGKRGATPKKAGKKASKKTPPSTSKGRRGGRRAKYTQPETDESGWTLTR